MKLSDQNIALPWLCQSQSNDYIYCQETHPWTIKAVSTVIIYASKILWKNHDTIHQIKITTDCESCKRYTQQAYNNLV